MSDDAGRYTICIHTYIIYIYIGTRDNLLILFEMFDSLVIWAFGFPLQLQEEQQKRLSEHSTESEAHRVAKEKNLGLKRR